MCPRIDRLMLLAGLVLAAAARAADPVLGPTFPIAEPDAAAEIKEKAAKADWQKWMQLHPDKVKAFFSAELPRATRTQVRMFDPTYELPAAMVDRDGKVLFPKGYKINVYQTLHLAGRYIVINGRDSDYQWLREVAKPTAADKVLLAGGNVVAERLRTHLPLYLLDQRFIQRFGLQAVPAVVQQRGDQLQITEYAVKSDG